MRALLLLTAVLVPAGLCAQGAGGGVEFAKEVLPILKARCFDCHSGDRKDANGNVKKPKGGLRLDGKSWIELGGKGGRVLAPGKSAQSELYTRTVLPDDHEDKMPAKGDPLGQAESALLARWIDQGARFGDWIGAAAGVGATTPSAAAEPERIAPASRPARFAVFDELAAGLAPLTEETLARFAKSKARVEPIDGGALVRVEFVGREDEVKDADLAALLPIAERVAVLSLARTKVTNAASATLAKLPRLVQLDLRETKIGDGALASLAALKELRQLNLYGTDVTDAGVPALARLEKLRSIQLWNSDVTDAGLAELAKALPHAQVLGAPKMPAPDAAPARGAGRPRKKN